MGRGGGKKQKGGGGDVNGIDKTDEAPGTALTLPVVMLVDGEKVTATGLA